MNTFQKLCSMVIFGLGVGLAAQGCAAPSGGGDAAEPEAVGEATQASCSSSPGAPIPVNKENAFTSCVLSCEGGNQSFYSVCYGTCCEQFTGCPVCYFQ